MIAPETPIDEGGRLEALRTLALLDTPPEPRFDRLTRLACCVTKTPIALISFVDADRQWFMSKQGLDTREMPREISFCGHAILQEEPLIVADVREDPRFSDNPLVLAAPFARFYAGQPIHAPGGARIGTLCVLDTQPRTLSAQEIGALADLAALVDAELLDVRFDIATRAVGVGVHERRAKDRDMWWSESMWAILGQERHTFPSNADAWLAVIHPEDQDHVRAIGGAWGKSQTSLGVQYRIIRPDGAIRYLQSIGAAIEKKDGSLDRIAGITLDVTERVAMEQLEHGKQKKLQESAHQAGMAEVATGVLHSVGNVVNSLGVGNTTMRRDIKALRIDRLEHAATLVHAHRATLACFLTNDERGRHLPDYLLALSAHMSSRVQAVQAELDTADALLEHLRDIVSAQRAHANLGGMREPVDPKELTEAALSLQAPEASHIEVLRCYEPVPLVTTDRHKLMLILVNLLNNARDAVLASSTQPRRIVVKIAREMDHVLITIEDSGVGIPQEVLSQLWRFGFTTKPDGQGFDLHNSANAAREIGATISAHSDGADKGARFTVSLPILNGDYTQRVGSQEPVVELIRDQPKMESNGLRFFQR
jgi:signal transduction histidine kinase